MADSAERTTPGQEKRKRLVDGARVMLHRQGVQKTTIADVAEEAGVPLGNVYYYFKTKDELVAAVVDEHLQQVRALLARLDSRKTPRARLKGLTGNWADAAPMVARSGCPLGSLCSELAKEEGDGPALGAEIFQVLSFWAEAQFRALGRRDAADLALMMLSAIQGAALLSNTLRDPRIMTRQVRQLDRWIDSLA
jgi:AcrR family transcriptional regulator